MSKTTEERLAEGPSSATVTPPILPHKTRLEKTQSMLTVISTSIGLIGVAGSIFAYGLSSFYTGAVEVQPDADTTDFAVKVYTKEGHESVFHTNHIELMPGSYHLEICSNDGRVLKRDVKIRFHKTNTIPIAFAKLPQTANASAALASTNTPPPQNNPAAGVILNALANSIQGNETQPQAEPPKTVAPKATAPVVVASKSVDNTTPKSTQTVDSAATSEQESNTSASKKRRWWQVWKRSSEDDDK